MLQVSQANALVYTTLVGFGFVGIYAGYRVKNKVDFLSGIKTQSGEYKEKKQIYLVGTQTYSSHVAPFSLNNSLSLGPQLVCFKSVRMRSNLVDIVLAFAKGNRSW